MKIAIYGSRRQHQAIDCIARFLDVLRQRGIDIAMHGKLLSHLQEIAPEMLEGISEAATPAGADLVLSLGGDGSFLRTALWVADSGIPIVGVNTGNLGFLAAISIDELPLLPEMIENNRLRIEQRSLLRVDYPKLPDYVGQYALNDVALSKEESASVINAAVTIDGILLANYRADGLIVCTSTGSTAYNLSAAGPVVQPTLDVCVLTPVAPHSLSMRPIVVNADSEIIIYPTGRSRHVRLAVDGRSALVAMSTEIRISKAPHKIKVIQRADSSFSDTLRNKFHWGEQ